MLELDEIDLKMIDQRSVVVLIGRRKTGKSIAVRDILYVNRDIPIGSAVSGTEDVNCFYGSMIPQVLIHRTVTPDVTGPIIKRQVLLKRQIMRLKNNGSNVTIDPRAFFVLDDCGFDAKSWVRDMRIAYMFMNGRHCDLLFLLCIQDPLTIPPNLRGNTDFVFIFSENRLKNRQRIYENWASMIPTFEAFCCIMDAVTDDHGVLVIHISSQSKKLTDVVFYFKAKLHEDFRTCDSEMWRKQDEKYDDEDALAGQDAAIARIFDEVKPKSKQVIVQKNRSNMNGESAT